MVSKGILQLILINPVILCPNSRSKSTTEKQSTHCQNIPKFSFKSCSLMGCWFSVFGKNLEEMSGLLARYSAALEQRPLATKAATSGILNALQELLATIATGTYSDKTLGKMMTMSVYGSCFSAPLGHLLYQSLERMFHNRKDTAAAIGKLLFTNFVISPILTYCYLVALAYSSGQSIKKSLILARSKFLGTMKMAWMINPTIQIYAFQRLDAKFWLPFFNLAAFLVVFN